MCPAGARKCLGLSAVAKGTAEDVLMRLREGSPTQQCRAVHGCARARGQGELGYEWSSSSSGGGGGGSSNSSR